MPQTLIDLRGVDIETLDGRPLVRDLTMQLGRERVAIVGRNGVGKTTLLAVLAGRAPPLRGDVRVNGAVALVPQDLDGAASPSSRGERRRSALAAAFGGDSDLLLLDEPTEDLDEGGRAWLFRRLRRWRRGLVVVSHDEELLEQFGDFFVVAESGCRHFSGTLAGLRAHEEAAEAKRQAQYAKTLNVLADREAHHHRVRQRRARKKAVGRLHELDRCQSRSRLNQRKSSAQIGQARVGAIAEARIAAKRRWAQATRRALAVSLPLDLAVPEPPEADGQPIVSLHNASLRRGDRAVFEDLTLQLARERLAVVGPNGAGKTSLLRVMLGDLPPSGGTARARLERIGAIAQGAEDWAHPEDLIAHLARASDTADPDRIAERLVAHRFPLALADRPLRSLSPGERTRAALICLFARSTLELLVLDEPTTRLDGVGLAALTDALRAWRGGLVVASHDRAFLDRIGVDRTLSIAA